MFEFNQKRFKALIHYICEKCSDRPDLGSTKLNKILWFSDLIAYINWGKPITGEVYIKRQYGPVPQHVLPALAELQSNGLIKYRVVNFYGRAKNEYISLSEPDMSDFSKNEIRLIDTIIPLISDNHTANSISEFSHDNKIWDLVNIGEEIPYYSMFAAHLGEVDETDVAWALEEMAKETA